MIDILIVEDNKEPAALLTDFLRAEGFTVTVVDSGVKRSGAAGASRLNLSKWTAVN